MVLSVAGLLSFEANTYSGQGRRRPEEAQDRGTSSCQCKKNSIGDNALMFGGREPSLYLTAAAEDNILYILTHPSRSGSLGSLRNVSSIFVCMYPERMF